MLGVVEDPMAESPRVLLTEQLVGDRAQPHEPRTPNRLVLAATKDLEPSRLGGSIRQVERASLGAGCI